MSKQDRIRKSKQKNKSDPKFHHNEIALDSVGELQLCYFMDELKEYGFIEKYERCESFSLCSPLVNNFIIQLKTKGKHSSENILNPHLYTPDFKIHWTEEGLSTFCNKLGEKWRKFFFIPEGNISYVEAKPLWDMANLNRLAGINIKFMWEKHKIFVQMVMNEKLFKELWVPKVLLKTKHGKDRTFKFKPKSIDEYLKSINYDNGKKDNI